MAETKNVKRDSKGAQRIIMGAAGLFLGCLFLFPIYILVLNSFKNTKGIFTDVIGFPNAATFTLVNYPNAFEALEYIRSFVNSLTITVIATVLILLISAMAAWVLVRYKTKTSKIIFFLFAASMLIPFQCVMLPLVGFASRIGIMNPQGLIFMYMGFGSSMSIVMFHSFIKNIPEELEEAATIDGAKSSHILRYIILPLLMPSITQCLFLSMVNSLKVYDLNISLTNGNPFRLSEAVTMNVYQTAFSSNLMGYGSAKALLLVLVIAGVSLIQVAITSSKEVEL